MHDPRIDTLANLLLDHSCQIQKGERVLIEAFDLPDATLVCRLVEGAAKRGALPFVTWKSNAVLRSLYGSCSEEAMKLVGGFELAQMKEMQAYIGIRGAANSSQFADVPQPQMDLYQKHWWKPVADYRVGKTKWVVLRYPTDSFAQSANMSTPAFEDFYFNVCTADYAAMAEAQKPLVARMEAADRVRIVAPGTELEFSIKGIPAIPCAGDRNIPDGEVFTAPVKDSINGHIRFNTPSRYQGTVFDNIEFEFKNGQIVKASANESEKLNKILDSDEGARYCGEWAIGVNNRVREPMLDTLFDE
jgi:aminopeptidase